MTLPKNAEQRAVDEAVRVAKDRLALFEAAERALIAPESLSYAEIKRISAFALTHRHCEDRSEIRSLEK